jgi:3',5'-cyclic AMP phosphodiesterase CpdA
VRTIVQLSDLHFGREDPALLEPLVAAVRAAQPAVLVVSGDLTQRARRAQFRRARRFLDRLPTPQVVVPGNHDVPLFDVLRRLVVPHGRFQRHVATDLAPAWRDDEMAIVGVNSAHRRAIVRGRVTGAQMAAARRLFDEAPATAVRVLVTHHPLALPLATSARRHAVRDRHAATELAECRIDLLLAGHLHTSHAGATAARERIGDRVAVFAQAGTSLSTRRRGEANAFNVLRVARDEIAIEHQAFDPGRGTFGTVVRECFRRGIAGWQRATDAA